MSSFTDTSESGDNSNNNNSSSSNSTMSIIGDNSEKETVETDTQYQIINPSSLPVHTTEEREELDHSKSSIETNVSTTNDVTDQCIAVQSGNTHGNDNSKASQEEKKQNHVISISSFMAGERPNVTENVVETPNRATKSHIIKPRACSPIPPRYQLNGTGKSSRDKMNEFIPKGSLQNKKPPVAKYTSTTMPLHDSDMEYDTIQYQKKKTIKTKAVTEMLSNVGRKLLIYTNLTPRIPEQLLVLGDHLIAQGEKILPNSTWVQVEGISPVSSLDAVLDGIQHALDIEEQNGIVDVDATWNETEPIPFLPLSTPTWIDNTVPENYLSSAESRSDENITVQPHKWVRKAKLIVSPFARSTGWYLKFENRSIVYALLRHAQEHPIRSSFRPLRIKEYKNVMATDHNPISYGNLILNDDISDATLRVENCPLNVSESSMLNFFSRYDLKNAVGKNNDSPIQQWSGTTEDGKQCPPTTYLVHFADSSWARAALREKQGTYMSKMGRPVFSDRNPRPLHLVQYPRQIL